MSDYGAVIGGVVGAVIGGMTTFGAGAQWGWMIGSAIGGAYSASRQVLPGPKIGEVQRQTSQEGGFRPIVFGRSHPIAGNVIADGGPKIVTRRERQGKGGPKVETESAYRTYAVGFCEGEATLLQAWRNGILVYDAEDPSMAAENAKFLEYATWYTGSFDQPASPDLEEIYGVGQAPYFRGTAYLSLHNEDVTDLRGAWSQWMVRVFRGAARSYTSLPYPLFSGESMDYRASPQQAELWDTRVATEGHEASGIHFEFGTAVLRTPLIPTESVEEQTYSLSFGEAVLRVPIVNAGSVEEQTIGFDFPGDATLRNALINTENSEESTIHFEFGEANLYVP